MWQSRQGMVRSDIIYQGSEITIVYYVVYKPCCAWGLSLFFLLHMQSKNSERGFSLFLKQSNLPLYQRTKLQKEQNLYFFRVVFVSLGSVFKVGYEIKILKVFD